MLVLDDYKKLLELIKKENNEENKFIIRKLEIVIKSIELKEDYDKENEEINKLAMELYKDMKPKEDTEEKSE